jgi:hypothetical protein
MRFPDNTPMLRSFKSRPLGSRFRQAPGSIRACRSCRYLRLRPRQRPANDKHAREPSLLAPKVRVQPLREIYAADTRMFFYIMAIARQQMLMDFLKESIFF